jgi:DNA-binding NarL/FixJ family response regulator
LARSDLLEIEAMIRSLAKQGSDNQQIADLLGLSIEEVLKHWESINEKLQLQLEDSQGFNRNAQSAR